MTRVFATIAVLLLASPSWAAAQGYPDFGRSAYGSRGDQDEARDAVRGGRQVPLSRVIGNIARSVPGRQLNTTLGDYGGRSAYFVQWQTSDGRVIIFIVDAESGGILAREGG